MWFIFLSSDKLFQIFLFNIFFQIIFLIHYLQLYIVTFIILYIYICYILTQFCTSRQITPLEVSGPSLKTSAERYGVTEPEYHPKQMLNTETLMHMTQLHGYHFWAVHIVFLQCFVYLSSGWLLE